MESLLERDTEFAALQAGLDEARVGRGGVIVVEGAPGAGKTALLRAFRPEDVRVLRATGGELEREFPFGVVRQLFERAVLGMELSGAAAHAAPVVGASMSAEPVADASFATLHGLYWLAATLAEEQPLLLIVDDAHWADTPSLRFLDFLGRRAAELALLLVIGTRVNEPGADAELLDALAAGATVLQPRPLSREGVRALVGGDEAAVTSALDATRGNPLLVRELVRALGDQAATSESVAAAVPSSLTRSVERRLQRVGEHSRSVAKALAVLGRDAPTLAAVTGLSHGQVIHALNELRAIDLVEDGAFIHPLLRAAAAESVSSAERDRLHQQAASYLRTRPGADDDVIVHLLAAPPLHEAWAAIVLREGAQRALAEGVPEAALKRLRRALEEVEPSDAERPAYDLELGRAAVRAGDPGAIAHLTAAAEAPDANVAALAVVELVAGGQFIGDDLAKGIARLREVHDRLDPREEAELRDRLGGQIINALVHEPTLVGDRARTMRELAEHPGPGLNAHLAYDAASTAAPAADTVEFARRALADRPFTRLATIEHPTAFWAIVALIAVDEAELSRAAITDAEVTTARHRTRLGSTFVAFMRAEWMLAFGSAKLAEADAREALELWGALPQNTTAIGARAALVRALVLQGELEAAEREAALFPALENEATVWGGVLAMTARHELHTAEGNHAEAISDYEEVAQRLRILEWERTTQGHQTARHARNLIAAGREEEGRALAEHERAESARRAVASYEAQAWMALGHAAAAGGAAGGGEAAVEAFARAAGVAERSPSLRTRAEAQLELGAALRRAGRRTEARAPLALARDLATRIDATGLANRAAEELVVAGGRPRRIAQDGVAALTPSERRTAEHAARGLSNREIAETLYVTRKTVEFTLGNVYSKLGIRSRTELPAALVA